MPPLLNFVFDNGNRFIADVEKQKAVAVWSPPEGGLDGNYLRRLRGIGYKAVVITAKGLGDLERCLLESHSVRPPHLGKKDQPGSGKLRVYQFPPDLAIHLDTLPADAKGLVLWVIEGKVLSLQELEYLATLPDMIPKLKVVVEVGSDNKMRWQGLADTVSKMAEGR